MYTDGPLVESVALPDGTIVANTVADEKLKVAETLDEYRGQFKYNLLDENLRAYLANVPMVNQWDDHEVTNNWYPGEILDLPQYTEKNVDVLAARARQAFAEFTPGGVRRDRCDGPDLPQDRVRARCWTCSCSTCGPSRTPTRDADGATGTVLGEAQLAWLKRELSRSHATWKVIAADLPIGLIVGDGTGAQEGVVERRERRRRAAARARSRTCSRTRSARACGTWCGSPRTCTTPRRTTTAPTGRRSRTSTRSGSSCPGR